jgi:hypothetical protein
MNKLCYLGHLYFLPRGHVWMGSLDFHGHSENLDHPKKHHLREILDELKKVKDVSLVNNGASKK